MKKEDILQQFPIPEQFMEHSLFTLTKEEKAFYEAYETACRINGRKPYLFQPLKGIAKKEKQKQFLLQNQCCVSVYGCLFDVVNGKIYKKQRDISLHCKPSVFVIERFYEGEMGSAGTKAGIFGKRWHIAYEMYCIYEKESIAICHINGQKEWFYKEGRQYYPKNTASLHKIVLVDEKKREIIWQKDMLFYTFYLDGRLKKIGDCYGNGILFWYINGFSMIERITSTFGQQLFLQYQDNKVSEITDTIGRKTKYYYEGEYLTAVQYPNGGKRGYGYEPQSGLLCRIENAYGEILFQTEYDRYYKPAKFYDRKYGWFAVSYDQRNRKTAFTGTEKTLIYGYNKQGLVEEIKDTAIGNVHYEYDAMGNMISRKNTKGQKSQYVYDAFGRVIQKIFFDGKTMQYQYNQENQLTKWSVSTGYQEILYYTKEGALSEQKKYLQKGISATIRYFYDGLGRKKKVLFADQSSVCYEYKNEKSIFPQKVLYANGFCVEYEYDAVNRLVQKIQGNETEEYKYNYMDLKIQTMYADGSADFRLYDLSGRLKEALLPQEAADGQRLQKPVEKYAYRYDAKGILQEVTAPGGIVFCRQNDMEKEENHGALRKQNASGKVAAQWIPAFLEDTGEVKYIYVGYEYDKCLRLSEKRTGLQYVAKKELPQQYQKKVYAYDARGNFVGTGNEKMHRYIQKNRLHRTIEHIEEGRERMYHYTYNHRGLLCGIAVYETDVPEPKKVAFQYDYNGNMTRIQLCQGKELVLEYDAAGNRIKKPEQWFLQPKYEIGLAVFSKQKPMEKMPKKGFVFEKDLKGRITAIRNEKTNEILYCYCYNCLDQIVSIEQKGEKTTFLYDKKQNIVKIIYPNHSYRLFTYRLDGSVIEKE